MKARMRIKNHVLAFFLLLSSAPFLWADESPPTIPENTIDEAIKSSESGSLDIQEPMQEETPPKGDGQEQNDISPIAQTIASTQQNGDDISDQEEISKENDTENDKEQIDAKQNTQEQQGADDEDQQQQEEPLILPEVPQIEEERTSDEYASSLDTDDDVNDNVDSVTAESVDESADPVDESKESAGQSVHEDGSSLPQVDSDVEVPDDLSIEVKSEDNLEESEIIENDDMHTEEEIIQPQKPMDDKKHEILYENGHTHLDKKDAEHDKLYKEGHKYIESDKIIKEGDDQGAIDVEETKTIIGTTSTKPIEVEGKDDGSSDETIESDGSAIDEGETTDEIERLEQDDNTQIAPEHDTIEDDAETGVEDEEEEESTDDKEKSEVEEGKEKDDQEDIEKIEELKDDDEDEDLAQKISVDYASKSAGALIIEKTREFKGTSNLITGDRDKYAIVPCNEEKKSFVLSLSEDILVKEIKVANYERFSSTVKDFQLKGSHTLGKWVDLGIYTAKAGMGEQSFVLETPAWARYLKFKFLTHHGNEWFCTMSQIKVHGSNMVQDVHEQWESIEENNAEDQSDDVIETSNGETSDGATGIDDISTAEKVEKKISNSSAASGVDRSLSAEQGDVESVTKNDPSPRHAQITPSVRSKPRPLDQFRNHLTFSDIIEVEMGDEKLFSDLYNIIPHTMEGLPAHVKNDLTCNDLDHEMRSVHQIGRLAMDSLYRFGTSVVDDFSAGKSSSRRISSAKMDAFSNEFYQKRFGKDISSLAQLYANNIVYPTSPSYLELPGESLEEANDSDGTDVQPGRQLEQESSGEMPLTDIESLDVAIQKLLKDLPSAECLVHLDFTEYKNRVSTIRKSTGTSNGSQGGRMMEPIFKKLTDEIFALQTSLSVHDQFSKLSVGCYQRVILDLALEIEKLRKDQDERLRRLEEQILDPSILRLVQKLIVSVALATASFLYSSGSYLFLTIKNVWIPKLLRLSLSKDSYETLHETYNTALGQVTYVTNGLYKAFDYASNGIKTLTLELNSKGWTNPETYQDYLSAWSTYYDGGMTVVFIVLTLLCLRLMMMCAWVFRPKKRHSVAIRNGRIYYKEGDYAKKHKKKSSKSKRRPKDPPVAQTAPAEKEFAPIMETESTEITAPVVDKATTETTAPTVENKPTEITAPAVDDATTEATVPTVENKPTEASVPIVEDNNAVKPVEESIPELKEEVVPESSPSLSSPKNNAPENEGTNRPMAVSPSVISLEEQ